MANGRLDAWADNDHEIGSLPIVRFVRKPSSDEPMDLRNLRIKEFLPVQEPSDQRGPGEPTSRKEPTTPR